VKIRYDVGRGGSKKRPSPEASGVHFGLQLDSRRRVWGGLESVSPWGIWSGCRDSNSGPLAPQAKNINHLQTLLNENKRHSVTRFGRQMDARTPFSAVRTPHGLPINYLTAIVMPDSLTA
jgi:hypothetical protein